MSDWLQHAHKPPARNGRSYDVFISYRSSDRGWAMALYDLLRLAGWEPFLDQYELVPGTDLEESLAEALEQSSSGVILFSEQTKDSEWCKRERNGMRILRDEGGFNYLFAKLDKTKLPLFARADTYLDFSDSPDRPRGANLLRLIAGLVGQPLTPDAARFAQEVDEAQQQALNEIEGAIKANNQAALIAFGASTEPGVAGTPRPLLDAANGLIGLGALDEALVVVERALNLFPKSLRAKQLQGLALRRQGKFQEAINILSALEAAGHNDPETLGILAAAWDGVYRQSKKELDLQKSRQLYETAFQGDPTSYYNGINAASKSLFLGEADVAREIADRVYPLVKQAADGQDIWAAATLAEVFLLRKEVAEAAKQYKKTIVTHPTRKGDLGSTRDQAARICKSHGLSEDDTKLAMAPFSMLDSD